MPARDLKQAVRSTRSRPHRPVNGQLIELYWRTGAATTDRRQAERWSAKVIDRLSTDLRGKFPGMQGLCCSNLFYTRQFAAAWPVAAVQQPVG